MEMYDPWKQFDGVITTGENNKNIVKFEIACFLYSKILWLFIKKSNSEKANVATDAFASDFSNAFQIKKDFVICVLRNRFCIYRNLFRQDKNSLVMLNGIIRKSLFIGDYIILQEEPSQKYCLFNDADFLLEYNSDYFTNVLSVLDYTYFNYKYINKVVLNDDKGIQEIVKMVSELLNNNQTNH